MSGTGFFTSVPLHRLPHPAVPMRLILATHAALSFAFDILRAEGFKLAEAKEDDITRRVQALLEDRLLGSREVAGFDRRRFRNVVRAPEISNHDGTHPAKKPDLVLFLLRRERQGAKPSQDGLFAECKPIDDSHPIGQHYCDQGIARFVKGEYGWSMQDGLMIGYVRGERTLAQSLAPVIAVNPRHGRLGSPGPPVEVPGKGSNRLHQTVHARNFSWEHGHPACPIRLCHSWHICG
jgi:hypothetical protein